MAARERPTVSPMLSYEDPGAAADWLVRAFGFVETFRYAEPDGRVTHVDLELGNGHVMPGDPGPDYRSPRRHAERCEEARRWRPCPYVVDGVHVLVDDLDEHVERAEGTGAEILSPIEESGPGGRLYRAADPEGHRWMFAERVG